MGRRTPGNGGRIGDTSGDHILIVEEALLLADVMRLALEAHGHDAIVSAATTTESVLEEIAERQPALVLLDASPSFAPAEQLAAAIAETGSTVLMVSERADRVTVANCLDAGAIGYVSKHGTSADLLARVAKALAGEVVVTLEQRYRLEDARRASRGQQARLAPFEQLSRREQDVLASLSQGRTAASIAEEHYVALSTVRSQIRSILSKLGVHSQVAAVSMAMTTGWISQGASESRRDRQAGATMVEYALMVAFVALVVAIGVGVFGGGVGGLFDQAVDCVEGLSVC